MARLYDFSDAFGVIYAWLGRTTAYVGNAQEAHRILKDIDESCESLFFTAEAFYFQQEFTKAIECADKALELYRPVYPFPGEKIFWQNGFAVIEEKCLVPGNMHFPLKELIASFRAFLWAQSGDWRRSVDEFTMLTRAKNASPDAWVDK